MNCSNLDVDGTITCKESLIIDTKTITSDELAVLDGVSAGTATEGKVLIVDSNKDITGINKISVQNLDVKGKTTIIDTVIMEAKKGIKFEGATINSHETTLEIIDPTETRTIYLPNSNGYLPVLETSSTTAITATPEEINILDGVTATTTDINRLEGVSAGAAIAGKALVASDNTKDVSGLGAIDCGAITSSGKLNVNDTISGKTSLTLDTKTVTSNELGVLAGVSAGAAIAGKALVASDSTKDVSGLGAIDCGAITSSGKLNVNDTD